MADETQKTNHVHVQWTSADQRKLLQRVQEHLDREEEGRVAKKTFYVKDIDWTDVSFDGFDASAVHSQWCSITAKVRKLRSAREILMDALEIVENRQKVPKRPKTSFFLFAEKKRPHLRQKYPNLGTSDLSVKLGKRWKKLSDEKKKKFQDAYIEQKEQFEKDLVNYYVEHFPEESPPETAFDLWSAEKGKEIKESRPEITEKKLKKKLNRKWEELDSTEKATWEKKAQESQNAFLGRMTKKQKLTSQA